MDNLIKNLNSLSGIRGEITNPITMDKLEAELKLTAKPLDAFDGLNELELSELAGIYYIEAHFPFKTAKALIDFGDKWGKFRSKEDLPIGISRYYQNRANNHTELIEKSEYIPFYLGKATNIKLRIMEHLNGSLDSDTYSLKLKSRPEIIKNINFKISYITLDINQDAYFGVELIEKNLRGRLNPIIGKQ